MLGIDEARRSQQSAGDGGGPPGASVRMHQGGRELREANDQPGGQAGQAHDRVAAEPYPDASLLNLLGMHAKLGGAEDGGLVPARGEGEREAPNDPLQPSRTEAGQHQRHSNLLGQAAPPDRLESAA